MAGALPRVNHPGLNGDGGDPEITLFGPAERYCDGVSRRSFLKIGSIAGASLLGAGGALTLPQILRAEEQTGRRSHKSVIMVYLSGGIAHQDTFDLKPNAPAEVRGEFNPIDTNVPGVQFCELLPKLSRVADKLAVVRSIVGLRDEHSSWQNLTGYLMNQAQREGRPNIGGIVSKSLGQVDPLLPAAVDLFPTMQHRPYNSGGAGVLGRQFDPVKAEGERLAEMRLRFYSKTDLANRKKLLDELNRFRRTADSVETPMDTAQQRAVEVLTSGKLVEALDVEREDKSLRERYGIGSPKHQGDGAPQWNDQLLMARRLVEAGVRCVTVAYGFWDTHGGNFRTLKKQLPVFDAGIAALVEDLHARGLDKDVTVCVWGEFGRTPKINKDAGRDHWPAVSNALLAGGALRVGQVIGSTTNDAGQAKDRPVHFLDVLATLYHQLGIDHTALIRDQADIPIPILPPGARVIRELV
ncbi:MAG: DUF1501 domain-containing protein [Planctomycetota bacterium]|nr:MAG: DUF1501 domain-containing protein [Planctomycetota bacterium]